MTRLHLLSVLTSVTSLCCLQTQGWAMSSQQPIDLSLELSPKRHSIESSMTRPHNRIWDETEASITLPDAIAQRPDPNSDRLIQSPGPDNPPETTDPTPVLAPTPPSGQSLPPAVPTPPSEPSGPTIPVQSITILQDDSWGRINS